MWGGSRERIEALKATRENRRHLPGLKIPERVSFTTDPEAVFQGAELIISAIPCQYLRGIWKKLAASYPAGIPTASVSKGIENDTLLRPTQIITDVVGPAPVIALSGPSIAAELARCLPATIVAASEDESLAKIVQQAFSSQWFQLGRASCRERV